MQETERGKIAVVASWNETDGEIEVKKKMQIQCLAWLQPGVKRKT
jgi:hypothetical protein